MKKKNVKAAMQSAKHSLEVENITITKTHDKLVSKCLNNEITEEQFLEEVRKRLSKEK
ncbi:hypothetical protein [Bacillus wiedmannii]|uniref:hypothetical protein n=1 Tax=Bacillus wiedmannii TaxID=1890302 RepID=UPI001E334C74|nr:hypothetical protein [Bacillus wiedmannii]MCC2425446.1 hypothetical protein [Bacillus wiedmannii]